MMKLHEAIVKLLEQKGKPMSTTEIARALNQNGWYSKKDGSQITPFQIHGRTKNYSHLFLRNGSMVSLKSGLETLMDSEVVKVDATAGKFKSLNQQTISDDLKLKMLMNQNNCISASSIDNLVPNAPGLYCIRIDNAANLPEPFSSYLIERQHNILYIGIATQSLYKRFLNQELRAIGQGTFFRSIGAVLGYRPTKGSLLNMKNKKNYRFSLQDQAIIIQWINKHLNVNWVEFDGDFNSVETHLIHTYKPLLNTTYNPYKLAELAMLRKLCREIANSH